MNDAQNLVREIEKELTSVKVKIAELNGEVDHLKSKALDLEKTIDSLTDDKVDTKEFTPVQRLVYGLVGLILAAVVTAMIGLVLTK